jgi:hypothetical protein
MTTDDNSLNEILDQLIAADFTLRAFMLEVSIELARGRPDAQAWAAKFITNLHARVDGNEAFVGSAAQVHSFHELARKNLDGLGRDLLQVLRLPPS